MQLLETHRASRQGDALIFDGHNDVLSKLQQAGGIKEADSFATGRDGALDLNKARTGGFCGGFFSVFVPSPGEGTLGMPSLTGTGWDHPLPEPIASSDAIRAAIDQAAILFHLQEQGVLKVVRSVPEIMACIDQGIIAAILHLEGADAIDAEFAALHVLYEAGLRSIGPVWSRPTIFGTGVPYRFPSGPDIGQGLTDAGLRLIRKCNELRILIDLSHLNEKGFWDVAYHSDAPLVATHSAVHAICPCSRNLTDDQLRAIAASNGMVGLIFAAALLREDGQEQDDVPLEQMLRHIDHMLRILGEGCVGLGSDYDGAVLPKEISTVADLPRLRDAMVRHGYGNELIKKLCHKNWLRVLDLTWGSQPPNAN